jgi:hypothetical protein
MTRRIAALALVGLLVLCGGVGATAGDGQRSAGGRIEGTWLTRVEWPDFPPFQYLWHFLPGGKTSFLLPFGIPPCAQGANPTCGTPEAWAETRVGCLGEWTPRGGHQFDVTMYCLPNQGDGYVPDRIRAKVTLAHDGRNFVATGFTYEWFNPDGSLLFGGTGDLAAKRLAHVPLH